MADMAAFESLRTGFAMECGSGDGRGDGMGEWKWTCVGGDEEDKGSAGGMFIRLESEVK